MRILVAPDAFKGSLSAAQAAEAMAAGIREAMPDATVDSLPLADGGEGTLDVLMPYVSHEYNAITNEEYAVYIDDHGQETAPIESARCLGLTLPSMRPLSVEQRGSGALGEVMCRQLDAGVRRFHIGLGGSATNDAGLGLLTTLGLRAFDEGGRVVRANLHGLIRVAALDASDMDVRLGDVDLTVLCDVDAPLCGPRGATFTFGSQKGMPAPADRLVAVDEAVARFATLAEAVFGKSVQAVPGSGAAGGLGFAFSLLGGRLVSGADYVIEKTGLSERLKAADWVVTGEGRSDAQTLAGKLPLRVAKVARDAGVPVALISGAVADEADLAGHFDAVLAARPDGMPVEQAMEDAAMWLRRATADWAASMARA